VKILSPERHRQTVSMLQDNFHVSERSACQVLGEPRDTQHYMPTQAADEDALTQIIVALAAEYGRYDYRRITALLQESGWRVGKDRVQRIWRREGLKSRENRSQEAGYGSMTVRAFGYDQRTVIMSDRIILSIMPPMTGAVCG